MQKHRRLLVAVVVVLVAAATLGSGTLSLFGLSRAAAQQDTAEAAARKQILAAHQRFTAACRSKDVGQMDVLLRDLTTPDFAVQGVHGDALRWNSKPLTRAALLEALPDAAKEVYLRDYVVERASITIDKLFICGDTAVVLTTGTGSGVMKGELADQMGYGGAYRSGVRLWSTLRYRDCQTWTHTQQGWKLKEVYLLVVTPNHWGTQTNTIKGIGIEVRGVVPGLLIGRPAVSQDL